MNSRDHIFETRWRRNLCDEEFHRFYLESITGEHYKSSGRNYPQPPSAAWFLRVFSIVARVPPLSHNSYPNKPSRDLRAVTITQNLWQIAIINRAAIETAVRARRAISHFSGIRSARWTRRRRVARQFHMHENGSAHWTYPRVWCLRVYARYERATFRDLSHPIRDT